MLQNVVFIIYHANSHV